MAIDELAALITGGTSGIGQVPAKKLSHLGIHVIVVGCSQERGDKTVAEIRAAGGKADLIGSDLRDASNAREVARGAVELGHVDIRRGDCLPGDGPFQFHFMVQNSPWTGVEPHLSLYSEVDNA